MRTNRFAVLILLGAVPLAGMGADYTASNSSNSLQSEFNALDVNHDGVLSRSEAQDGRQLNPRFESLDTNHDDQLSFSEFLASRRSTGAAGVSGSSRDPGLRYEEPTDQRKSGVEGVQPIERSSPTAPPQ